MLSNIFSTFDEQNGNLVLPIFLWLFFFFLLSFVFIFLWLSFSRILTFFFLIINYIWKQIMSSLGGTLLRGFSFFISFFFLFFILCNFLGMVPYVFSSTSHLVVTLSFAFFLWISLLLSSILWNSFGFFSHLLPSGAPFFLNPFLVIVESISIFVRPITLSVRLAANMGAGHIVMGLLGSYLSIILITGSFYGFFLLILIESFYFIFEFGVCLIQSYIFSLLLTLYSDEHSL